MHVPDGFVATSVNIATAVVSTGVGAVALRQARRSLGDRQVPILGVTAAFVFAAQMLNFPIAGGTSGHFLGGLLACLLLGPWGGFLVMAAVLVIQCLLFADGGLTALGTNIFNMAIVAGLGGYLIFRGLLPLFRRRRGGMLAAVSVASWLGVVSAAAVCALELAVSGTSPLRIVLPAMVGVHALIGVGEAIITTGVVSLVIGVRPDILPPAFAPRRLRHEAA